MVRQCGQVLVRSPTGFLPHAAAGWRQVPVAGRAAGRPDRPPSQVNLRTRARAAGDGPRYLDRDRVLSLPGANLCP